MKIDYRNSVITSKNVDFDGEMEDGRKFTINAHWNNWDDWSVDNIEWHDEQGTDEEEETISAEFLEQFN